MKSSSIKKTLPTLTWMMVLILSVLLLPFNILAQLYMQHQNQKASTKEMFGQLEQLIETNERTLERSKQDFAEQCIEAAEMAAYFVEHYPETISSLEHTKELAEKLGVDEIHYFTPEGEIYAGTHPEYYGFSFDSGEQMHYFCPMLEDHSLKLCQEIMPNTAEGKEMQYAAVWMEDDSGIVQIGMEPIRLLALMEEKSLKNVIAMQPFEMDGYLHIIDRNTKEVIASTEENAVGRDFGMELGGYNIQDNAIIEFHYKLDGQKYCVYAQGYGDYFLIRSYMSLYPIRASFSSTILMLGYIVLIASGVIGIIRWYISRRLVGNLLTINEELKKNESGSLEDITLKTGITEFDELLFYINHMLGNIRSSWDKMSYIMDKGKIPIGILEKDLFYKKMFVNECMMDILEIQGYDNLSQKENVSAVQKKLDEIETNPMPSEENIYVYDVNGKLKYLRIEKDVNEQNVTYYVTDISQWKSEIDQLRMQSEIDPLVNLYNRRGFNEKVKELFAEPEKLGCAAIIMLDADNLKPINDIYGHQIGDEYLEQIAEILRSSLGKNAVCGRLGGDEFIAFVYGASSLDEIENLISKLRKRRGEQFVSKMQMQIPHTIQFSMGAAYYPKEEQNFHVLMRIADEKMYQEKKERKHRL